MEQAVLCRSLLLLVSLTLLFASFLLLFDSCNLRHTLSARVFLPWVVVFRSCLGERRLQIRLPFFFDAFSSRPLRYLHFRSHRARSRSLYLPFSLNLYVSLLDLSLLLFVSSVLVRTLSVHAPYVHAMVLRFSSNVFSHSPSVFFSSFLTFVLCSLSPSSSRFLSSLNVRVRLSIALDLIV